RRSQLVPRRVSLDHELLVEVAFDVADVDVLDRRLAFHRSVKLVDETGYPACRRARPTGSSKPTLGFYQSEIEVAVDLQEGDVLALGHADEREAAAVELFLGQPCLYPPSNPHRLDAQLLVWQSVEGNKCR